MTSGENGCDLYRAPTREARAELRDRGSRFLAILLPTAGEDAAQAALQRVRDELRDATHHCWARRLGHPAAERASDDGEPAGTAGVPMLQVLRGAGLSDVTAVVVRWYGGTKLGKGGLARAYAGAVRDALGHLPVRDRFPTDTARLTVPYDRLGAVQRLVRPPEVFLGRTDYAADIDMELVVRALLRPEIDAVLADLGISPTWESDRLET
jgi:uncharacterized YigZ family protein